ncbi:MAG TPA: hypothetical protein VKZ63_07560, partial [Kofleriaceae bacterium]|nr:hypothetical protein [Kofleriaceae bacterium]
MSSLDALVHSPGFAEAAYEAYRRDPASVPAAIAEQFRALEAAGGALPARRAPAFLTERGGLPDRAPRAGVAAGIQIYDVVHTYRQFGHMAADIDPLGQSPRSHPYLELSEFGLSEADLDEVVSCEGFYGADRATVRDIIDILRETYCGPIGVEFMDVADKEQRDWL